MQDDSVVRVFNEQQARKITDEIVSYLDPVDAVDIKVSSWWGTGLGWARNQASMSSNQCEVWVFIRRFSGNQFFDAYTNQIDSESLKGISNYLDTSSARWRRTRPLDRMIELLPSGGEGKTVWNDETFNRSIVDTAIAVEELTRISEQKSLMASGYIETNGATALAFSRDVWGRTKYEWGRVTEGQCSVTVRHSKGTASGWAGLTSFDVNRISESEIANRALEKCIKSFDPVRIEPGRYQSILEPQATASLLKVFVGALTKYQPEQSGDGVLYLGQDNSIGRFKSKLGLRIVDNRLNLYHDPTHPVFGTHTAPLHRKSEFIREGVLVGLADELRYHQPEQVDVHPLFRTSSYVMNGGNTPMEEMISKTERGLLVSKLSQLRVVHRPSMLCSGVTRDGLWLIENGRITKSVKNFRWTESPMFAFNNVEQIGLEEQVFEPVGGRSPFGTFDKQSYALSINNVVAPALKVNDFSFTSTIDAI